jgi:hypothetical protein
MKSKVLLLAVIAATLALVASATMWAADPISLGNANQFGVLSFYGSAKFNQVAEVDPAYVPSPPECPGSVGCSPDTGAVNIGLSFHDYLYGDAIASLYKGIGIFMGPKNKVAGECVTGGSGVLLGSLSDCDGGIDKSGSNSKVTTLLPNAISDAKAFSQAAAALTATQTLSAIYLNKGQNYAVTTQAGLNVIDLPSIITKGYNKITITAGATDAVIFNLGSKSAPGQLLLGPSTQIVLYGGITPDRIMFNVLGAGGYPVSIGNGSTVSGTILAPYDGINVATDLGSNYSNYANWTVIKGALIAGKDICIGCLVKIYFYPFTDLITPPTPTPTPTSTGTPTPPANACLPSSSLAVLVQGTNVSAYVPKGSWTVDNTGIAAIQIEGSGTTPTAITTAHAVNSCASNPTTGKTVCVSNGTDVYVLTGTGPIATFTDTAAGTTNTSGGTCATCGVSINQLTNQAILTEGTASGSGAYQFMDLGTNTFATPIASGHIGRISEELLVDPSRQLILAASEDGTYELVDTSVSPIRFFENNIKPIADLDSSAEDCSTGVALAGVESGDADDTGAQLYLANLSQASLTAGSPGTWNAPAQFQSFLEFSPPTFTFGPTGIAVAEGSHIAVVASEFGGNGIGAVQLPASAGTGIPAAVDYVGCTMPNEPGSVVFVQGKDPHTVTAYVSPNGGHAIGLTADAGPNFVGVVDLTKLLDTTIVPRLSGTHQCDLTGGDLAAKGVVTYIAVP